MVKLFANLLFATVLNLFKGFNCFYNVRLSYGAFLYMLSVGAKQINLRNVTMGNGVTLKDGCSFFNEPEIFGKVNLGRYTSISGPGTRICAEVNEINIGSFCSIASNVIIQEYYHDYRRATTYNILTNIFKAYSEKGEGISKGSINIEDDVWIGSNSVILSGVTIGRGAIIGAGSVVTKDVERYSVVGGNPAKKIRDRFSENTKSNLEKSEWWLWDVAKIRANKDFFILDRSV